MRAPDLRAAVASRVEELDEAWFTVAAAYVSMARKDGNAEVVGKLEEVYSAAVSAKEATLRAEIRLLNALLRAGGAQERAALLAQHAGALDLSEEGYFFTLLARMTSDVEKQPESAALNPGRPATLATLRAIAEEARQFNRAGGGQR